MSPERVVSWSCVFRSSGRLVPLAVDEVRIQIRLLVGQQSDLRTGAVLRVCDAVDPHIPRREVGDSSLLRCCECRVRHAATMGQRAVSAPRNITRHPLPLRRPRTRGQVDRDAVVRDLERRRTVPEGADEGGVPDKREAAVRRRNAQGRLRSTP